MYSNIRKVIRVMESDKVMSNILRINTLLFSILALVLTATSAIAQEGHPFDGTWRGTLESEGESTPVLLIMDYDGDTIQGTINPGRRSSPFLSATLDSATWTLLVEAESREAEAISFAGVLKEVGARNRYMVGSWTQGDRVYNFRVNRE